MSRKRPYRKREPVARVPRPPHFETIEDAERFRRELWEPWEIRQQARDIGRQLTPRHTPSRADREIAETEAAAIDAFIERVARSRRLPLSERVPEMSLDEIRARHGL